MKGIPKGWSKYQDMGERIAGTKMIPFKVPLSEELCHPGLSADRWFTPSILLQRQPGLKAVIDLTDTTRYYDPQDFSREGVVHVKIRITGGGTLPSLHKLQQFFNAVDQFMENHADDPDALVGVHCTHGLNRTGYFICHYMVDRLDMSPDDAIARFEAARGHAMHRANFINEIRTSKGKLSGNGKEKTSSTDSKRCIQYSSPLGDSFDEYDEDRSRRRSYGRPNKTNDNWRRRDASGGSTSIVPNFQNFNKNKSSNQRYDDKSRHSREKRPLRDERREAKHTSSHPYKNETSHTSFSGNWRDLP